MPLPRVEVCYSAFSYPLYSEGFDFEYVIVIDVLRATTAIITGLAFGVAAFIPVATLEEALLYQQKGYTVAAERDAKPVEGFPLGNSPLAYTSGAFKNQTVVITTTNGTEAIRTAKNHHKNIVVAALCNLSSVCEYFMRLQKNVLIVCAGWKNKFNMEDSICAGGIVHTLLNKAGYVAHEDSTIASKYLYLSAHSNFRSILKDSSHRKRLQNLGLQEDIKFCLTLNSFSLVPVMPYNSHRIIALPPTFSTHH